MINQIRQSTKNKSWYKYLDDVVENYNDTEHITTKNTPDDIIKGKKYNEQRINKVGNEFIVGQKVRIKIKKSIFTEPNIDSSNPLHSLIHTVCPPKITIDIEFKITPKREEFALKRFYKSDKSMNSKSYKELKALYYSTKIINFVNVLRGLLRYNTLWLQYTNELKLKTKYKPDIDVSDALVLSLI